MSRAKTNIIWKRIVDAAMTVLLLFLMAYQVTGEIAHEWIGMGMTVLVIIHQILNRKWYGALFRGKYNPYRGLTTILNILLLLSFALTAFCGMSMSGYAVPFLYGMAPVSFVRRMHLSMSHWAFVLMGLHLGMHIPAMTAGLRLKGRTKIILTAVFTCIGGTGLYLFLQNSMPDYLFFRVPFAFLDYEKAGWLVFLENLLMLSFWAFTGTQAAAISRINIQKANTKRNPLIPVTAIMGSVIIGIVLMRLFPSADGSVSFENTDWSAPQAEAVQNAESAGAQEDLQMENASAEPDSVPADDSVPEEDSVPADDSVSVNDGFKLIQGGAFLMGSPDTENWRIEDEMQHEVNIGSFCIDPYETTQGEYASLMGENPSTFAGDDLPVENISWLDAVRYANAKSADTGLTPVYTVTADGVSWDLSAEGYRLPTEAEWEYACRAGTTTPFNTEKSPSAAEANFYGHYPFEIEENYEQDRCR